MVIEHQNPKINLISDCLVLLFTYLKLESYVMMQIWLIQQASNSKVFFMSLNTFLS